MLCTSFSSQLEKYTTLLRVRQGVLPFSIDPISFEVDLRLLPDHTPHLANVLLGFPVKKDAGEVLKPPTSGRWTPWNHPKAQTGWPRYYTRDSVSALHKIWRVKGQLELQVSKSIDFSFLGERRNTGRACQSFQFKLSCFIFGLRASDAHQLNAV